MLMDCIDRIAMLLTQGGGLWAAGVSGVYVNAVVPFHRVLAISRPLAQLTRGIIGIKGMGPRDLGLAQPLQQRRITSGVVWLSAPRRDVCVCAAFTRASVCSRWRVCVGNACAVRWPVRREREGFTHQHFPSRATHEGPTLLWDPACSLWHRVKQQNNERSEKLCEGSPRRVLRLWHPRQDELKFQGETIGNVGIAPRSPQQEVILHQPIN